MIGEALLLAPMLYMAAMIGPGIIMSAGLITLTSFAALTAIVWVTKKDFSFMGVFLKWIGIVAIIAIVASLVMGFSLGVWFSAAMVLFAGGIILYTTSNVMRTYPSDRHVSASLELFAAVALLFWYVLRLVMSFGSD